ncbi:scaffolding protein [Gordonia phage BrutonGaster]|uniref:Scaffolding protein n=1 Tax=Gordonia phage BrutonGaster TaxID=2530116 RepID=A0A482JH17_9CAUD|nr:head scaffolding protein [Gordonia phage BrutonGaster]QBP33238.1 scaffolding protein [Gordonia phage BrutonGaster]
MTSSNLPIHPVTGLRALGIGKRGPIWPVIGGSVDSETGEVTFGDADENADSQNEDDGNGAGPDDGDASEPQTSNGKAFAVDGEGNSLGYPVDTPVKEMSVEEQMNYWKRQSRKKEDQLKKAKSPDEIAKLEQELADLKAQSQTADEKKLEEAVAAARAEGETEAKNFYLPLLHETQIRGYAHPFLKEEKAIDTWLQGIAIENFVDSETQMIDGEKVNSYLKAIYGEPGKSTTSPQFQNTGQFQGRKKERVNYAQQGAEIAARRFGTSD